MDCETADVQTIIALFGDEIKKFCQDASTTVRIIDIKTLANCTSSLCNMQCRGMF